MPDESTATLTKNRPNPGQAFIRMYGQGVGDCFLLVFPRSEGDAVQRPFSVVIDCGVIGGTPGGTERMRQVVKDIKASTLDPAVKDRAGNPMGHVDLLVI